MITLCAVTGTRAEFGIMRHLLKQMQSHGEIDLKLVVTGTHLSPEHGMTVDEITAAGFLCDAKCEVVLSSDTPEGVSISAALALIGLSGAFGRLKPDMVLLLGDRYEAMSAAMAATIHRIPIAHIHGGESTFGLIDESFRHSITKMSYLHFAATEPYRRRIIQLGEEPERVYHVGALGVENIGLVMAMDKTVLENELDMALDHQTILVTYHPETLRADGDTEALESISVFVDRHPEHRFIFTMANADPAGTWINRALGIIAEKHPKRCKLVTSLGQTRFFTILRHIGLVMGNSSSGIIEVPSFNIPTINMGNRQLGRIAADSVFHCENNLEGLEEAYLAAVEFTQRGGCAENPYDQAGTSQLIIDSIIRHHRDGIRLDKTFFDMGGHP